MVALSEIEAYFKQNPPTKTVKIRPGEGIINPPVWVEKQIGYLKANPGNKTYLPYYHRLRDYYLFCKDGIEPKYEGLDYKKIRETLLNNHNNEQTKN